MRSMRALLIRAAQPPHREFDVAIGQFTPAFDAAHIGGLGIAGEEIARPCPRLVARQGECLAQKAVVQLAPAGHPVCEIARTRTHVATPTNNDRLNIALAAAKPSLRPVRPQRNLPGAGRPWAAVACFPTNRLCLGVLW